MKTALFISCFEEWYKERIEPIVNHMKANDYHVVCALSDYNHIRKNYSDKEIRECTYIHVPKYKSNISIQRIISHLVFGKKVKRLIREINPDLIYLVVPPNNTAQYCKDYKKRNPDTKLILDIIDLWPESLPIEKLQSTPMANMWKKWRNDCLIIADHIFTECDLYQEKLRDTLNNSKTSTLYLFKEQSQDERTLVEKMIEKREKKEKNDHTVKFAYLGSMNNIIDIKGICSVIQNFKNVGYNCELHAIGDGESREEFKIAVETTGCSAHFYGAVFDEIEKIRILAPCDYAFNMMKSNISVGLTIKSIDYLSYGLPLINNIKGDTWKIVDKEEIGINVLDYTLPSREYDHNHIIDIFNQMFSSIVFKNTIQVVIDRLSD